MVAAGVFVARFLCSLLLTLCLYCRADKARVAATCLVFGELQGARAAGAARATGADVCDRRLAALDCLLCTLIAAHAVAVLQG